MNLPNLFQHKRTTIAAKRTSTTSLSSAFAEDSVFYVTSDAYGQDHIEVISDSRNDESSGASASSSSSGAGSSSSSTTRRTTPTVPQSLDFEPFDGRWDDEEDTREDIDGLRDDNREDAWGQFELNLQESAAERIKELQHSSKSSQKDHAFHFSVKSPHCFNKRKQYAFGSKGLEGHTKMYESPQLAKKKGSTNRIHAKHFRLKLPWIDTMIHGIEQCDSTDSTRKTEPPTPTFSDDEEDEALCRWDDDGLNPYLSLSAREAGVRYSKRSCVTDGSQVQSLAAEDMERRIMLPNECHLKVSHWTEQNKRGYMEDRVVMDSLGCVTCLKDPHELVSILHKMIAKNQGQCITSTASNQHEDSTSQTVPLSLFAVFDGHSGGLASQYCCDWISSYLKNQHCFPHDLPLALKNTFHSLDRDFLATGNPDGSTACACVVVGGKRVLCANAGDSRAIVVRKDGTFVKLSKDHKPGTPDELKRITELGGRVIYSGRWRVEGRLAVSRGIGDAKLKRFISSSPDVYDYNLQKNDWFLVVASDGVWDHLDNDQVAKMTLSYSCIIRNGSLKTRDENLRWTARKLCEHARSLGSRDNLSAIVVDLVQQSND